MTNFEPSAAPLPAAEKEELAPKAGMVLGQDRDKEKESENIYLDLDTILDTRLGTLGLMSEDGSSAVKALDTGQYHKRLVDEFEGISSQAFREAYGRRDNITLRMSPLTNVVFFLRRLIKDSLMSAVIHQKVEKMCFTVNVWPYDFSDPDLVDMLIGAIRFHTYSTSSVSVVSIPNEELTPEHCVRSYQIMIRYEWVDWVSKHKPFFEQRGIPSVTVVAPEMFYEAVPTQDDIDRLGLKKQNPFRLTETQLAPLFRLKYMPVSLFSMHEDITKKNAAEISKRAQITQQDIEEYLDKHYPKATLVQDTPLPAVDLSDSFELL